MHRPNPSTRLHAPSRPDAVRRRHRRTRLRVLILALIVASGAAGTLALVSALRSAPVDDSVLDPVTELLSGASATGDADGVVGETEEVDIDSDIPAVARLDDDLRDALRAASRAAAEEDVVLDISSGWRSERYQQQLFQDAIAQYGSEEAAQEFVAPADKSKHVTGEAVDIGGLEGQLWLLEHGSDYGLCQTFANERWHFELVTTPGGVCPEMSMSARDEWTE